MSFAECHLNSLNSSNLLDDKHHRATEALAAAALADLRGGSGSVFGSMLVRAKIDGMPREAIVSDSHNLAVLLRACNGDQTNPQRGYGYHWQKR